MPGVNVAVIVGSNRRDSINRKLARALVRLADGKLAASFVRIDDLPMYNQDLESPLPESVALQGCDRGSYSSADRDTPAQPLDSGCSQERHRLGTRPYGCNSWVGKVVAIIGTSPGVMGTAIAQQHLRQVLGDLRALVMGGEAYVMFKPDLIDETGTVADTGTLRLLQSFIDQFAGLAAKLTTPKTYTVAA